jgi:DNA-binding transcriptional ArsR family regulator
MTKSKPWYVQRKRELEAAAPVKRKRVEPFVKVPRWWMAAACKATDNHKALVCVELLYVAWKAKSLTFPLSNARLEKLGVHRETKRRALRDLEGAGLIPVERQSNKTPIVTVLLL